MRDEEKDVLVYFLKDSCFCLNRIVAKQQSGPPFLPEIAGLYLFSLLFVFILSGRMAARPTGVEHILEKIEIDTMEGT